MLLVDATGYQDSRFEAIDQALLALLYGDETSVFINRSVGNGVVTYTTARLEETSKEAKYPFPVTDIRLACLDSGKEAVQIELNNGGIVIVDEADQLDRFEGLAEALRALESPYIKFVYVALVHKPMLPESASESAEA